MAINFKISLTNLIRTGILIIGFPILFATLNNKVYHYQTQLDYNYYENETESNFSYDEHWKFNAGCTELFNMYDTQLNFVNGKESNYTYGYLGDYNGVVSVYTVVLEKEVSKNSKYEIYLSDDETIDGNDELVETLFDNDGYTVLKDFDYNKTKGKYVGIKKYYTDMSLANESVLKLDSAESDTFKSANKTDSNVLYYSIDRPKNDESDKLFSNIVVFGVVGLVILSSITFASGFVVRRFFDA